jgi:hypothetical protein
MVDHMHLVVVVDLVEVDRLDCRLEERDSILLGPYVRRHLVVDCCMAVDCWCCCWDVVVHMDLVVEDDDTPLDCIPGCSKDLVVGKK